MARYALVIGIGQNQLPLPSLSKTVGDAKAIALLLRNHGGFEVQELTGTVTAQVLEQAFVRFLEQAHQNEALIYYTGHGFPLAKAFGNTEAFLAASDCEIELDGDKRVMRQRGGLSLNDLNGLLSEASLSNLVMLLDCCHSGYLLEQELLRQTFSSFSRKDYFLITACRSFEQARAKKNAEHSVFTQAVLEGLSQKQADKTGCVSGDSLFGAVAAQLKGSGQEALRLGVGRSLPIVIYRSNVSSSPIDESVCPYQGLSAFTPETKQFFFGRDGVVLELLRKLQKSNFVPVIGPSGIGKSSIVRAGLVPRLTELGWRILGPMTPDEDPFLMLKQALKKALEQDCSTGELLRICEVIGVKGSLIELARLLPGEGRFLLVVDQFEELFTYRQSAEQPAFIRQLVAIGNQSDSRLAIVTTMRSDFIDDWLKTGQPPKVMQDQTVMVGAWEGEEWRDAIVKPAELQGYGIGEGLLELILADVEAERNCLPLLEFSLSELWEQRNQAQRLLTAAAYRKLGGVTGALNFHAEDIYKKLASQKREQWVRPLILRLVRTGVEVNDTRQRKGKSDLLSMARNGVEREAIEVVLKVLIDSRLLVSDRSKDEDKDIIDMSHEALMTSWERLIKWREQGRDTRRNADKVADEYQLWDRKGRRRQDLLDGRLLKLARQLLKDAPVDVLETKYFIKKSLLWRRIQISALFMIPLLIVGVPTEYFWREFSVKQDLSRLEKCSGRMECQAIILSLIGGCKGKWNPPFKIESKVIHYAIEKAIGYPTERLVGNCRPLDKAKLRKSHLPGVDLSNSFLHSVDLSESTLHESELININFDSADLSSADLVKTNLSQSFLHGSNLRQAKLNNAKLIEVNLDSADLTGADLTDADLSGVFLHSANLSGANLEGVKFGCLTNKEVKKCSSLKDIEWNKDTNWQGIQGWENVENIPPELKQQLELKGKK
jgi:hypothetical protein